MRSICSPIIGVAMLVASTVGVAAQDQDTTSTRAVPSAGCGSSQVEPGMYLFEHLQVGNAQKMWSMLVPEGYDGTSALPLWVDLHGVDGSGAGQIGELASSAQAHGFVVAAPTEELGNAGWTWREQDPALDTSLSNPDIVYIVTLLDHLGVALCIDLARVYVAGYSGGGEGASVLGCVLEDRIAAVAPSAGMLDPGAACQLERPVPFLAIHGTVDGSNYFDGGLVPSNNEYPVVQALAQASIPERVTNVALRNGCQPEPVVEAVGDGLERWTWACPADAKVELLVHDGGHLRPANTIELIWAFFEQHPMPE